MKRLLLLSHIILCFQLSQSAFLSSNSLALLGDRQSRNPAAPGTFCRQRPREALLKSTMEKSEDDNDPEKLNSLVSLVGGTTSLFVSGLFYVVLVWKRNAVMSAFFIGSIGNAVLGKVLKKIINQTRPPDMVVSELRLKPSDGGMPSSHAMSLGFIGTFTFLHQPFWLLFPILLFTATSLLYRVQVKLHTWEQVVVGLTVGSTNAFLFYTYVESTLIDLLQQTILNQDGLLPYPFLIVPSVVGALVVGSVERRITNWVNRRKEKVKTT